MKKYSFKRAIVAGILCVATLFTVACGGTNNPTGNEWWTTTGSLTKDADGKVVFSNVEIKLNTVVAGDDKQAFYNVVQRFNREYDGKINVIITNTGAGTYEDTVSKQINNNTNPPDLIMSHQKSHKNFADNRLIQPLNEAMEQSGITLNLSDYSSGLAQYSSLGYEGKTYSIPIDGQSLVVVYNKQLLAKYATAAPTDRAGLLDICRKFKEDSANGGKAAIAWATGGDYFVNYMFLTALLQNGVSLYKNNYTVDWYDNETNRAAFKAAFTSFRELFDNSYANLNEAESTALTDFVAGKRLFYFLCPWELTSLVNQFAATNNVSETEVLENHLGGASVSGWFAMSDNANKNAIYGDSHFFAMSKTVTDINVKAAIVEFIRWFTVNSTAGAQWAKAGHVTASNVIAESDVYKNDSYVSTFISKFYPDIDNFRCVGNTPYYADTLSNLQGIFADTVGNKNATDATDEATIKSKQNTVNNNVSFFG